MNVYIYMYIQFQNYTHFDKIGSASKESTCNVGDLGLMPGWEDPLEKGMATHSHILAWRIPCTV